MASPSYPQSGPDLLLPRLYAICDTGILRSRGMEIREYAQQLHSAGVKLVQLRDKEGTPQDILAVAAVLREVFLNSGCQLVLNDHPDLALLAGFGGVHVGQHDLAPEAARRITGNNRFIGVSTHTDAQVQAADLTSADYIAIGPVFPTATKLNPDPVIGLEGVRRARALTSKPLVAIGGITRDNARSVLDAGADSVAVISALFAPGESVEQGARDFLHRLR